MTDPCRDLLDQVEPKDLTQIALQMLFTIERMELIIPEITDTIRKALEQGHPTPQLPAAGEVAELARRLKELAHATTKENWREFDMRVPAEPLRDADLVLTRAADLLQRQLPPVPVSERMPKSEDCDEQKRCWWLKQRANPDHDLLMPTWHLQRQGPAGTTFFRFTHWLPANALPTPEANR